VGLRVCTLTADTLTFHRSNPLKSVIRSLQRLLTSSGGADGLRNLVDTELPKSLKLIVEAPATFGPRVFATGELLRNALTVAITLLSSFVHNEPTSLAVLQELQIPQVLYMTLEQGIPPSFEVRARRHD
jgi:E3 ubiquitin-protein ligase HUWE1